MEALERYIVANHAKHDGPQYWWLSDVKHRFRLRSWEDALKGFARAAANHGIHYQADMLAGYVVTGTRPVRRAIHGGWELVPEDTEHFYARGHKHDV